MKAKTILLLFVVAALSAGATWYIMRHSPTASAPGAGGRKVLYYQSSMHPWIKSDKPGKCTICGMDLVPVFEGEKGYDVDPGMVTLASNSVSVIHVQTQPVRREPLRHTLRVAGMIEEADTRHRLLSAYVDGRIDKLFVNFVGAEVRENELLATFYSPVLLAAEREYALLAGRAPETPTLREEHARLLEGAAERLRRLGLQPAQIAALAQKSATNIQTELRAPLAGTVVARFAYEGQYVKEGEKLFEIADFSTVWFRFDVYERDLAWLKVGQTVTVTTPAVPGKTYTAPINFIEPNLQDMTRSAKVRVELQNPLLEGAGRVRRELLSKTYAEGTVEVETPAVLAAPRSAVLAPGRSPIVYVKKGGGAFEARQVQLGRAGDALWEVLAGLEEGDEVVTAGNLLIDAQAQLNQSASAGGHADEPARPGPEAHPSPPAGATSQAEAHAHTDHPSAAGLSEAQRGALSELFTVADGLGAALARDDLAAFKHESLKVAAALAALTNATANVRLDAALVQTVVAASRWPAPASLPDARRAFWGFSQAVVDLAHAVRAAEPAFASLKLYQCPMVKQAFPGAPQAGRWLQLKPPVRNPYFGKEMLDCGNEITP
jgi:Cu(I)/Ag(I) efflux system membrane fusion protein